MLRHRAVNLCVTLIPVHIREHPAFSLFQVRSDAFRNPAQLFASAFFRYPGLSVFDPSVEAKLWILRFHWPCVLLKQFAFALRQGLESRTGHSESMTAILVLRTADQLAMYPSDLPFAEARNKIGHVAFQTVSAWLCRNEFVESIRK